MTRIAPLEPPYDAELQSQFDQIMPPGKPPLLLFRSMARSMRVWRKIRGGSVLDRGPLTLREREIIINRVCARTGCEYEWGVHIQAFSGPARLIGAEIEALEAGAADLPCWSAAEQALIATIDALHDRATLDDTEFARLRCHFDEEKILEILLVAGAYRTISYFANSLAIPLEPGAPRFPSRA